MLKRMLNKHSKKSQECDTKCKQLIGLGKKMDSVKATVVKNNEMLKDVQNSLKNEMVETKSNLLKAQQTIATLEAGRAADKVSMKKSTKKISHLSAVVEMLAIQSVQKKLLFHTNNTTLYINFQMHQAFVKLMSWLLWYYYYYHNSI